MGKVLFNGNDHEKFYNEHLAKCRRQDAYHKALVYCLGIDEDTREHVDSIYDFKKGLVNTKCLHEGWQTSGSEKIVRMAFNLYCDGTPSVQDVRGAGKQLDECRFYTVGELFCCGYAKYFWEAIKLRYPDYCAGPVDLSAFWDMQEAI